jgi:anti-sigma factor RsiW
MGAQMAVKESIHMSCPSFEALIEYADGRSTTAESAAVERHLRDACASCQSALDWYARFIATARADESAEPPTWVTRRALDAFADAKEAAARRGMRGLIARLRAALVFDSFGSALAGDAVPARNASSAAPSRQLLYSATPFDVDLYVAEGGSSRELTVSGQVLPVDGDDFETVRGLTVTIELDGLSVASVETTELGEFSFEDLAPGTYDVRLSNDDREIVIWRTPLTLV